MIRTKKNNIQVEWDKIKDTNIFTSFEEFKVEFDKKPEGKCFRKYTAYPWCKENFFFGTNEELHNYYKTTKDIPFYLNEKIGNKYSSLTVKSFFRNEKNDIMANCVCDCGREVSGKWRYITENKIRTCGCRKGNGIQRKSKQSIKEIYPDIIKDYWDFSKNTINPEDVNIDSKEEFWWKGYKNSFKMPISYLSKKKGGTSFPEQTILFFLKENNINALSRYKIEYANKKYEVDLFLPEYNVAIEYDGVLWHKQKLEQEIEKNKAVFYAGISFIRIRESGLLTTGIKKGIEIFNNIDSYNSNYSLAQCINELFEYLENLISIKFCRITENDIISNKTKIYRQYALSYDVNNLNNSWMINHWSDENGIEPYLINTSASDKFIFKCNKNQDIYISPNMLTAQLNKISIEDEKLFKEKLICKNSCPLKNTEYCPANKYYNIYNYYTGCEFADKNQKPFKEIKDSFVAKWKQRIEISDFREYLNLFKNYHTSEISNTISHYLTESKDNPEHKFKLLYESIHYPYVLHEFIFRIFENENVQQFYVQYYNYKHLQENELYLNLEHNENIYDILKSLIYTKKIKVLKEIVNKLFIQVNQKNFDKIILNLTTQLYIKNNYLYDELFNTSNTFNIALSFLMENISEDTKNLLNTLLATDRETVMFVVYKEYVNELFLKDKLNEKVWNTIYARLNNDSIFNKLKNLKQNKEITKSLIARITNGITNNKDNTKSFLLDSPIMKFWDYEKNDILPENVTDFSKIVYLKCPKGKSFKTKLVNIFNKLNIRNDKNLDGECLLSKTWICTRENVIPEGIDLKVTNIKIDDNEANLTLELINDNNCYLSDISCNQLCVESNNLIKDSRVQRSEQTAINLNNKYSFLISKPMQNNDNNKWFINRWNLDEKQITKLKIYKNKECLLNKDSCSKNRSIIPFSAKTYNMFFINENLNECCDIVIVFNLKDSMNYVYKICLCIERKDNQFNYYSKIIKWREYDKLLKLEDSKEFYNLSNQEILNLIKILKTEKLVKIEPNLTFEIEQAKGEKNTYILQAPIRNQEYYKYNSQLAYSTRKIETKYSSQSKGSISKSNSKFKKQNNKKTICIILVSIILALSLIFIPLINTNNETSNIKGVEYTLNDDNETYTMTQDTSIWAIFDNPPDNLKIPEKYNSKPITNIDFFSCKHNIETIQGSKNLETIDNNAFDCRCQGSTSLGIMNLKTVVFPIDGKLKNIYSYAFYKCSNLESIVLPENFEGFGRGVFYCCTSLKSIYIYSTNPPSGATTLFDDEVYSHGPSSVITIYVPSEAVESYKNSDWSRFVIKPIGG